MLRRLHLALLLMIAFGTLKGQGQIGFSNANGFPALILPSQNYNLSGWIVNNGAVPLSGNLDISMKVNGGPSIPIDNNFPISGTLLPGDSVYWNKQGHNFPNGQFAPGNNDVLIWPTRSISGSGTSSDSLHIDMYYADEAAFALLPDELEHWTMKGISIHDHYAQDFHFKNVGEKGSCDDLGLYIKVNDFAPERLAISRQNIAPDDKGMIHLEDFVLFEYLKQHFTTFPEGFTADISFFVEEEDGMPYAKVQTFKGFLKANVEPLPLVMVPVIGPNPNQGILDIRYDGVATSLHLFDTQGRKIAEYPASSRQLDLSGLPLGNYLLRITTAETAWTLKVSRQ